MFDTYRVQGGPTTVNERREVHEHRAPTDESVRLLREMEAAARAQVVQAFVPTGNTVRGAVVVFLDPARAFDRQVAVAFDLNGAQYRVNASIEGEGVLLDARAAVERMVEAISRGITAELLKSADLRELTGR